MVSLLLIVIAIMVLSLMGVSGSQAARTFSETDHHVSGDRLKSAYETHLRTLASMLPKGPVPPSGPSSIIH